jgi:hypothetical protein
MLKRWRRLILPLLTIPLILFGLGVGPAAAFDDFGISEQGFNNWQYDACATHGDLHFQYLGYRYSSDTITVQFWVGAYGWMHIYVSGQGTDHPYRVYQLGLGRVWYAHISARLTYTWWFDWRPDSGGDCAAYLRI